jgi:predicted esterase
MNDPHRGLPVVHAGASLDVSRAVVIMVHGRNASPANILDLVPRLAVADCAYVAPTAADRTWYPFSFLSDLEKNEPNLSSALGVLETLVADLESKGILRSRIVLLGFSQGACLAVEFACRRPTRYGGVIGFSGGLIGPPGTAWERSGRFEATPIFLGCSDVDAHVPRVRVEASAQVFREMGADVTLRIYPGMGHVVNDDEIDYARALIRSVSAHESAVAPMPR